MEKDVVCGMQVDPARAAATSDYNGKTYYFCGLGCRVRFVADPDAFLHPALHVDAAVPGGTYTCPMHPEIIRDHPDACPICGMALEPREVTIEEGPNPELVDMSRRLLASAALTGPLLIGAMGGFIPQWLELALATPVVLWGAFPFFVRGWQSIVNRSLNMFTLIALGVTVAYGYSVVAALFPELFPTGFRDDSGNVGVYFEVAAAIVTLILLGQVLELRARSQTGAAPQEAARSGGDVGTPAP